MGHKGRYIEFSFVQIILLLGCREPRKEHCNYMMKKEEGLKELEEMEIYAIVVEIEAEKAVAEAAKKAPRD